MSDTMECLRLMCEMVGKPAGPDPIAEKLAQALVLPIDEQRRANVEHVLATVASLDIYRLSRYLVQWYCTGPNEVQPSAKASLVQLGLDAIPAVMEPFHTAPAETQLRLVEVFREIGLRYCTDEKIHCGILTETMTAGFLLARGPAVLLALAQAGNAFRPETPGWKEAWERAVEAEYAKYMPRRKARKPRARKPPLQAITNEVANNNAQ